MTRASSSMKNFAARIKQTSTFAQLYAIPKAQAVFFSAYMNIALADKRDLQVLPRHKGGTCNVRREPIGKTWHRPDHNLRNDKL